MSPANRATSRRRIRTRRTRGAILATADRVFANLGLAGARMDAIADAAGVNKALLYYYFKNKDALYEAVVEEHFREFNQQALALLESQGPAGEILLRYVGLHFDFISARRQSARLFQQFMMTGGSRTQRLVQTYFKPRSEAVAKLLERGMREGEFRQVDGFHAAVSIIALIVFYFSAANVLQILGHSSAYDTENLNARKREVIEFIRHALFLNPD